LARRTYARHSELRRLSVRPHIAGVAMPIRVCVINQLKGNPLVRAGLALSP